MLLTLLDSTSLTLPLLTLLLSLPLLLLYTTYQTLLHPLSPLPGPLLPKLSPLPLYLSTYLGTEPSTLSSLHARFGPVLRIAPHELSISDGRALRMIYGGRGLGKAACYTNFYIDGHATLFSGLGAEHRARRVRAVGGLFGEGSVRKGGGGVRRVAGEMAGVLEAAREEREERGEGRGKGKGGGAGKRVDVLSVARAFALDASCGYLFGRGYGALAEVRRRIEGKGKREGGGNGFLAEGFVDELVGVGRFFYLPPWLFGFVEWVAGWLVTKEQRLKVEKAMQEVQKFADEIVAEARNEKPKENEDVDASFTYPARLLAAGMSVHETQAQCKDLMFAGTDSTGMNLATIIFILVKFPECYKRLRKEVVENEGKDLTTLEYLGAVVKEGLRVSMANPTRLPRRVPQGGITLPSGHFVPEGTNVGIGTWSLHFNEEVYSDAMMFKPERWIDGATEEMHRDLIPFGMGSRMCIARTLAKTELLVAVETIVKRDVLAGARCLQDRIEIWEWFNSRVKGEKIEIAWD